MPESETDPLPLLRADSVFHVFFILSACFLTFIAGALLMYYKLPGSESLRRTFIGGEAVMNAWLDYEPDFQVQESLELALTRSKVFRDKNHDAGGYTLMTFYQSSSAYLIDSDGHVVYQWYMPYFTAWPNSPKHNVLGFQFTSYMRAASLLPNGDLVAVYENPNETPYGEGMVRMDKDSHVKWTYNEHTHHDVVIDETHTHIYGLIQDIVSSPVPGLEHAMYPMLLDSIVILSPEGKELKRLSLAGAFVGSRYASMLNYYQATPNWDYFHTNAVTPLEPSLAAHFPMFKAGQLLVSLRNMDTIAVIDPDSGKVVWAVKGAWKAQHAAKFLPNGHILLMDNKGYMEGETKYSRILEIDPVSSVVTWSYTGSAENPFYTSAYGRAQRLPDQTTLVVSSDDARMFEVNPEGKITWDYALPGVDSPLKGYAMSGFKAQHKPNAIVSAVRYTKEQLPFLRSSDKKLESATQ